MNNKLCPLKIDLINDNYWCIENNCAWWVERTAFDAGQCAITQLATTINCEVKLHG